MASLATGPAVEADFFDTRALARLVRDTPDRLLAQGLRLNREAILAEVFRRFGERLTAAGRRRRAVIEWKIAGAANGDGYDRWFVVIRDGECTTGKDLPERPRVTLQVGALDFLKIVTGNANPAQMFLRRQLRVKGDLILAARMPKMFAIPGAEGRR